jgi:hypothetical protein
MGASASHVEWRLAAILAADVAGYSAWSAPTSRHASRSGAHWTSSSNLIREHHGRVVESATEFWRSSQAS